ncbi:unnamed protein product [Dicrocoelium dendriticum]|nr:unnamed protein product [Dicrocoelium dendriticum]
MLLTHSCQLEMCMSQRTDHLSLEPVEKEVEALWNENKPAIDAFLKTLAQCITDRQSLECMKAFRHALYTIVQFVFNTPESSSEVSSVKMELNRFSVQWYL